MECRVKQHYKNKLHEWAVMYAYTAYVMYKVTNYINWTVIHTKCAASFIHLLRADLRFWKRVPVNFLRGSGWRNSEVL